VHDPNPPHTVYGLTIDSCSLIQFWWVAISGVGWKRLEIYNGDPFC
jgi:hypothetical protein